MPDRYGIDVSNYSSPFTDAQLTWLHENDIYVVIGLQDAHKAREFKAQCQGLDIGHYVDLPGREISIADPGAMVWIDIEVGCFQDRQDVLNERDRLWTAGLHPWIYGNKTSIQPVFGNSTELSNLKLAYADYRTPDLATFVPFNGWTKPDIWQYSPNGVMGINADLWVWFDAPPLVPPEPEPPYVKRVTLDFSDEGVWHLDVVPPPGR